jgi:hypothetical protein
MRVILLRDLRAALAEERRDREGDKSGVHAVVET